MTDAPLKGAIKGAAVLDLTSVKTPEELERIESITGVALILVPESLMGTLNAIPQKGVAATVPIPDGARPQVHTGSVTMGGEGLGAPDAEDKVLVVTGALVVTSPIERVAFREVIVTGLVLAPEGSEAALGAGLTRITGSVEYYRYSEGQRVHILSGQTRVSGETLANEGGNPEDVLVLAGQCVVTGQVRAIGFQRVIIAGQCVAPRDAEPLLGPLASINGQMAWYTGQPRFFIGSDRFGRDFFELLDEPIALGLIGGFTIEEDVTVDMLRSAIGDILLVGALKAPRHLMGALQLLTTEKHGAIKATEDAGDST